MSAAVATPAAQRSSRILPVVMLVIGALIGVSGIFQELAYYWDDIVYLSQQHIYLVVTSGGAAILVGVPVGILLSRPFSHADLQHRHHDPWP